MEHINLREAALTMGSAFKSSTLTFHIRVLLENKQNVFVKPSKIATNLVRDYKNTSKTGKS